MHRKRLMDVEAEIAYYTKKKIDEPDGNEVWDAELKGLREKYTEITKLYESIRAKRKK